MDSVIIQYIRISSTIISHCFYYSVGVRASTLGFKTADSIENGKKIVKSISGFISSVFTKTDSMTTQFCDNYRLIVLFNLSSDWFYYRRMQFEWLSSLVTLMLCIAKSVNRETYFHGTTPSLMFNFKFNCLSPACFFELNPNQGIILITFKKNQEDNMAMLCPLMRYFDDYLSINLKY